MWWGEVGVRKDGQGSGQGAVLQGALRVQKRGQGPELYFVCVKRRWKLGHLGGSVGWASGPGPRVLASSPASGSLVSREPASPSLSLPASAYLSVK